MSDLGNCLRWSSKGDDEGLTDFLTEVVVVCGVVVSHGLFDEGVDFLEVPQEVEWESGDEGSWAGEDWEEVFQLGQVVLDVWALSPGGFSIINELWDVLEGSDVACGGALFEVGNTVLNVCGESLSASHALF